MFTPAVIFRFLENIISPLLLFLLLISTTNASSTTTNLRNRRNAVEVPPPASASAADLVVVCTREGQTIEVSVSVLTSLVANGEASYGACEESASSVTTTTIDSCTAKGGVLGSNGECYDCTTCPGGYDTGCQEMEAKTCTCIGGSDGVTLTPICHQRKCSRLAEANFNEGRPTCLGGGQQLQPVPPQQPPQGGGGGQTTTTTPPPPLVPPPPPPTQGGQTTTTTPPPPLVPPPTSGEGSTNTNTAASCSDGVLSEGGECYNCNKCPNGYNDGCNDCSCGDDSSGSLLPGGCTEKFCKQPGQPSCLPTPNGSTTTTTTVDSEAFCSNGVVDASGECYDCNTCPNGYNDGCNNCFCGANGTAGGCNEKFCLTVGQPSCLSESTTSATTKAGAFCSNGVVSRTTGQCYDCNTCPNGYNDGCNDCFCGQNGSPGGCTEMFCKLRGEPSCW